MLSRSDHEDPLGDRQGERVRHYCRNVRCGGKLKVPTNNLRDAFCCQGCHDSYYRGRCLVCERPFDRKTERRQLCSRPKCKRDFQRHTERFCGVWYRRSVLVPNASRNPANTDLETGTKSGRAFRPAAGPTLSATSLRLATIPLDSEPAARLARQEADYLERRRGAKRRADRKALIKRRHPPVNILGGYRFPNAPVIDLSPIEPPLEWSISSRWKPSGDGADMPDIPAFLRRSSPGMALPAAPTPESPERSSERAPAPITLSATPAGHRTHASTSASAHAQARAAIDSKRWDTGCPS